MDQLVLISILLATVAVPALAARVPDGRRALGWTLLVLLAFTLAYVAVLTQVYTQRWVPEPFEP